VCAYHALISTIVNLNVTNSYVILDDFITFAMDKSADLKDLDLTCASRGVWLVKVGHYPVIFKCVELYLNCSIHWYGYQLQWHNVLSVNQLYKLSEVCHQHHFYQSSAS